MTNDYLKRLLKNSQSYKLSVLEIVGIHHVSLFKVKDSLGLSSRQLRSIVKALNADISVSNKEIRNFLTIKEEFLTFNCKIGYYEFSEVYHGLVNMYLRDSGFFQVLMFVFENRIFSVIKISTELSYSESYVYKILNNIRNYFLEKGWDVYITKKNETHLELAGSESSIRILHYLHLSFVLAGREWFIKSISEREIEAMQSYLNSEKYIRLSPNEKNKINTVIGIFELALKNGYFVSMPDKEVNELGNFINRERVIELYYRHLNDEINGEKQWLKNEVVCLGFILSYFSEELRTLSDKERIGGYLRNLSKNEIVSCCNNLLLDISKNFYMSSKTYDLILYTLSNRLTVIHYLKMYQFLPQNSICESYSETELIVDECIEKNLRKFRDNPSFMKVKSDFKKIILQSVCCKKHKSKKLYIELSSKPDRRGVLENYIKSIFNSKSIAIVDSFNEAEIVISDTIGYNDKNFFYVQDKLDTKTLEEILVFLSGIIVEADKYHD